MSDFDTELGSGSIDQSTVDAAASTVRRTGRRLRAPQGDVDAVLGALFSTVLSPGVAASKQPADARRSALTEEEKQQIRVRLADGRTQQEIADEFDVSRSAISGVKRGRW